MQEIFAHFPTQSARPSPLIGGQIFDVRYHQVVPTFAVQEELATVPSTHLNPRQIQILEELAVFQHATADLLLRKLRLRSLRYLQKQIYALHAEKPEDRYVEFLYPP